MHLFMCNHRSWFLTVLFVSCIHVHRGHCKSGFFKPFIRDSKVGFVKTDEQTYHTAYEFDLDHAVEQTGRFFKRFTENVFTDAPNEDGENLQETTVGPEDNGGYEEPDYTTVSYTEEHITNTEANTELFAEEHQSPTKIVEPHGGEHQPSAKIMETHAGEHHAPTKEESNCEGKSVSKHKSSKKKNKKKFDKPGNLSILKNLRLMFLLPIKVCKYELKPPEKQKQQQKQKQKQKAPDESEDCCGLIT